MTREIPPGGLPDEAAAAREDDPAGETVSASVPDEAIERLLELSRRRAEPEPARLLRIREAVEPHWRGRARRRRALTAAVGLALAATVLVAVLPGARVRLVEGIGGWLGYDAPSGDSVASVQVVIGPGIRRGGSEGTGPPLELGSRLRAGQAVESGEGRVAFRLGDETQARLDRGSALRFLGRERLELQRGAVYVDTGRDVPTAGGGVLEVVTPFGVVEDIGTRFEVRLEESELVLRIRDGSVLLHHGRGTYEGRAGEELRLGAEGTVRRRDVAAADPVWGWTLELSSAPGFDGAPLREILAWASRETGRRVRFEDAVAEGRTLGATVRGDVEGLPVQDALAVVLPVAGLGHRLEGDELVVAAIHSSGLR